MMRLLFLAVLCAAGVQAAEPVLPPPSEVVNRALPPWIRFKGEYRGRWEGNSGRRYVPDADDHYLLTRLRLDLAVRPVSWFSLTLQGQDSRVTANRLFPTTPQFEDVWDLRLAFVELSRNGQIGLRVGRQELMLGDQRLLGRSNWGNTSRVFDAVRADWQKGRVSLQAFAASVVANRTEELNHHIDGDNVHAIVVNVARLPRKTTLELQSLWRLAPRVASELGGAGKLNTGTLVFRGTGEINARTRYVTEMALQAGRRAGDKARAAAGHWRVHRDLAATHWKPVLTGVYDYATGDKDPNDGRVGTFDVMYPTPHDKYGLSDQVGWKNIHHAELNIEFAPRKDFRFQIKQHAWWLASRRDWLYTAGGAPVARDVTGSSGRYVGRETDLQAFWVPSKQVSVGMGVGRLSPGEFVKRTTPGAVLIFPYVMVTYAF